MVARAIPSRATVFAVAKARTLLRLRLRVNAFPQVLHSRSTNFSTTGRHVSGGRPKQGDPAARVSVSADSCATTTERREVSARSDRSVGSVFGHYERRSEKLPLRYAPPPHHDGPTRLRRYRNVIRRPSVSCAGTPCGNFAVIAWRMCSCRFPGSGWVLKNSGCLLPPLARARMSMTLTSARGS